MSPSYTKSLHLQPHVDHYIGIDVGTGSARACVIDHRGDIVGLASENIGLWQPEQGYYVRHPLIIVCPESIANLMLRSNPLMTSGDASALPFIVS